MADITGAKLRGVATHKNPMSEVKQGACARAESLVLDRESCLEPRRGVPYEATSPFRAPGKVWKRIMQYEDTLIYHVQDELWRRTGAGTATQYTGTYADPETGFRVRDAASNKNLYFTTALGTYKLDAIANTPRLSGTPPPLDGSGTLTGSSGYMADDTAVGYRATLYYTDANDNEIESAASQSLVVQNTVGGGATRNVALTWYIPSGLTTSYYWRIYRSAQTEDADDVPSEEVQVCAEGQLSSANISAGNFTVTDSTPDNLRGATAYFSPSQEGITGNNDRPPLALDLCVFRGYMFHLDILGRQRFFLRLLGTGSAGSGIRFVADNVATTNASAIVTSVATTTTLHVGMKVKAAAGIPSTARILTIDSATQITMTVNATATGARDVEFQDVLRIDGVEYFGASATVAASKEFLITTGGTASQNIEATARAICFVVNQNATGDAYGYYFSNFEETPGAMLFEERGIGGSTFQFSTSAVGSWSPTLPATDDSSQVSKADEQFNQAAIAKFGQPEACPVGQTILLGDSDVLVGLPLRDAVIILSDVVGIVSGTDISNFRYDVLDATCKVIGPETAVVVNDSVFCMSNQGPVRITTQGVQIAGRDIERDLIMATALTGFATNAFGIANETERAYGLAVPTGGSDTLAKFIWRYNALTDSWTHSLANASCGVVDLASNQLVLADQDTMLLRRERKTYDRTDYADDQLAVNITGTSGVTLSLTSTANLLANDLIVQGSFEVRISAVVNGTTLTMASEVAWSNGAAIAYRPIDCEYDTLRFYGEDPALLKKFTELELLFLEAEFGTFTIEFATDFSPNFSSAAMVSKRPLDTASAWADLPAGADPANSQVVRAWVPRQCMLAHELRTRITWSICRERMVLGGVHYKFRTLGADKAKGAA